MKNFNIWLLASNLSPQSGPFHILDVFVFFQNVKNHIRKLKFFFFIRINFFHDTLALIDCFALNIDRIIGFWNFGLFWHLLACFGLYVLFGLSWFFKAKIGGPMSESDAIDVISIPRLWKQFSYQNHQSSSQWYMVVFSSSPLSLSYVFINVFINVFIIYSQWRLSFGPVHF